jgi:hypothetical protein
MADRTTKALIAGQSGCGKTTLIRALAGEYDRVLHWDTESEYRGTIVRFCDLPFLFRRRAFRAIYRPQYAQRPEELAQEFDGLASLLLDCAKNILLTVDEAVEVLPRRGTGGLGRLLFKGRKRGISLLYATQYVAHLPAIIGASKTLYLFRLDGRGDQQVLRSYLQDDMLRRVAALPPHEYLTVRK